jgi:hypothetical protein
MTLKHGQPTLEPGDPRFLLTKVFLQAGELNLFRGQLGGKRRKRDAAAFARDRS